MIKLRAHHGVLRYVLDNGVQHLQQRVAGGALNVRRVAADGQVEDRAHRLSRQQVQFKCADPPLLNQTDLQ